MKAVIYCRVSTREQGDSRLGLEAQEVYCKNYCLTNLIDVVVVLTEVISATTPLEDRSVFINCINVCRATDAMLIVAKQDRISRDEYIWHSLALGKTFGKTNTPKIVIAESPHATTFELSIRAAVAAEERRNIAQRTKAALAVAKTKGIIVGEAGRAAYVAKYGIPQEVKDLVIALRKKHMSHKKIANELYLRGYCKKDGSLYQIHTIQHIIKSYKKNPVR